MKNIINFLLFVIVCFAAHFIMNVNGFFIIPEIARVILGCPPPVYLINIALVVYAFSAITIKLCSIAYHKEFVYDFNDLGYCSGFFFFYSLSGALAINFMPVAIIGLIVHLLNLIHYTLSTNYTTTELIID